ncbi:hypothetical protein [Ruminococcus sp.]
MENDFKNTIYKNKNKLIGYVGFMGESVKKEKQNKRQFKCCRL